MKIKLIDAYEYGNKRKGFTRWTYDRPSTVARVSDGANVVYLIPYGVDYECDGGHHVKQLTAAEFRKQYSTHYRTSTPITPRTPKE